MTLVMPYIRTKAELIYNEYAFVLLVQNSYNWDDVIIMIINHAS